MCCLLHYNSVKRGKKNMFLFQHKDLNVKNKKFFNRLLLLLLAWRLFHNYTLTATIPCCCWKLFGLMTFLMIRIILLFILTQHTCKKFMLNFCFMTFSCAECEEEKKSSWEEWNNSFKVLCSNLCFIQQVWWKGLVN